MAELSVKAIQVHKLEIKEIHNDSTTVTFPGEYAIEDPDAAKITYGYNKDHRPDCKQLVFGLNITGDGHVPVSYQLYDGNQSDVSTHTANWEKLRTILGKEDFIYIADSKLFSIENLTTIAENNGQFITIVPRNFSEVKGFLESVREGTEVEWQHEYKTPDSRKKGGTQDYLIHVGEHLKGKYRVLWVHSKAKETLEYKSRENKIAKAEEELKVLSGRLNRYKLKTHEQIKKALTNIQKGMGSYISVIINEKTDIEKVQIGRGKPNSNTQYKEKKIVTYELEWERNENEIHKAQRIDGLFPWV